MAIKITMPKLSDTMTEGTLVKWLKKEGEAVEAGDVIAEAESDKATMELETYDSGVIKKIMVPDGGKVGVGGLLAIVGEEDENIDELLASGDESPTEAPPQEPKAESVATPEKETRKVPEASVSESKEEQPVDQEGERIKVSPLAKKLAIEKGIDLATIAGSGPGGRIVRRDIDSAHPIPSGYDKQAAPISREPETVSLSSMRSVIAKRMTESKSTVPHFYLTIEIDMDEAEQFRKSVNAAQSDVKISFNDMIVKASAIALKKHKFVNGSFMEDKIVLHNQVDVGVAVALDEGLITPVVRDCDIKSLIQIAQQVRSLAKKAKDRKLLPEEYSNATFTISNLGMFGIEEFSAIISKPEAAILAVGAIRKEPVVKDDEIVVGSRMKVTLSCDHRIVDGATGALFLREIQKLLEKPMNLVL